MDKGLIFLFRVFGMMNYLYTTKVFFFLVFFCCWFFDGVEYDVFFMFFLFWIFLLPGKATKLQPSQNRTANRHRWVG